MIFFVISFIAGLLTVLTPCVLPMLPIILAGTATGLQDKKKPFLVVLGLAASVFIFTILLKVSTIFINVPGEVWQYLSGLIIFIFGISLLFPGRIHLPGNQKSNELLGASFRQKDSNWKSVLIGAALGPVFTTCSPTFFVILATVLPSSITQGVIYLLAYDLGLAIFLLAIAFLGQKLLLKLLKVSDPESGFMKFLGVLFILLAIAIAFGYDKRIENYLLQGPVDFTKLETSIRSRLDPAGSSNLCLNGSCAPIGTSPATSTDKREDIKKMNYIEIVNPSGFVNSESFKLKDLIGKKVILVDFMTYSCINCQRTYPYLKDWYQKYKDKGLEIVAIQTPEFSFEKRIENVTRSAKENGLTFPIVLDNDYGTWNAYRNQYWPHKYLIDLNGNIVYDHIGEGNYQETEDKIVELLSTSKIQSSVTPYSVTAQSPETYFGAQRNEYFGNGTPGLETSAAFSLPNYISSNKFYLEGKWSVSYENASPSEAQASITYRFNAKDVFLVAESAQASEAEVYLDNQKIKTIEVKDSKLYPIISLPTAGEHTLKIIFKSPGIYIYTFTFG
jgi:cytochrome c biogenesis protein CcdA/thiol-disulfide isomerase/thioredoxin